MEIAFVFLVAISALAGLLLRRVVGRALSWVVLAFGLGAFAGGLGLVGLAISGAVLLGPSADGLGAAVLLGLAAALLPFAIVVSWRR